MGKSDGPDSTYAWFMVAACFIVNSVTYGMIRSQGVLYVNVINNFGVSRAEASWPFSLCVAFTSLTAPLASALSQRYGSRVVIVCGAIIATAGLVQSFFAQNIAELVAFVGVVHGFGMGLAMTPIPITINQYFVKHRATAQGVAFSGATLASFALPSLLDYLVKEFSLRGAFLISAGIVLHAAIGGTIIKTPKWLVRKDPNASKKKGNLKNNVISPTLEDKTKGAWDVESRQITISDGLQRRSSHGDFYKPRSDSMESVTSYASLDIPRRHHNPNLALDSQSIRPIASPDVLVASAPSTDPLYTPDHIPKSQMDFDDRVKNLALAVLHKITESTASLVAIVKHPMFILICISWAIFMFVFLTYILIVADFAIDQGIDESKAVLIFTSFSGGDLFGRLGLGWVTDRGYVRRRTYLALSLTIMGALVLCQPFLGNNYTLLLATATVLGTIVGSTLVLFFVLYAEYLKPEQVPLAIGLNTAFNGTVTFARPIIVGFFRDHLGSYTYLFYTLGAIMIGIASLWSLEPIIMRKRKSKEPKMEVATIS